MAYVRHTSILACDYGLLWLVSSPSRFLARILLYGICRAYRDADLWLWVMAETE
jgi:hypothetical protein